MTWAVAVVVEMVENMDMAWSCIAVLDVRLQGCIEVVLEHRWCIVVAGTGGADSGVDDAEGVAGAEVDVVVVQEVGHNAGQIQHKVPVSRPTLQPAHVRYVYHPATGHHRCYCCSSSP